VRVMRSRFFEKAGLGPVAFSATGSGFQKWRKWSRPAAQQLEAEGIVFEPASELGVNLDPEVLARGFDAICLAVGAGKPRESCGSGARSGRHPFAMDYPHPAEPRLAGIKAKGSTRTRYSRAR